MTLLITILGRI